MPSKKLSTDNSVLKEETLKEEKVDIQYFTDVLCVWAYVAQVRLDELSENFGEKLNIGNHFMSLFGCTEKRMQGWKDKGGFEGYADHVVEVCSTFSHINLHQQVWRECRPTSSSTAHHFLKAVSLTANERLPEAIWATRLAFFKDARDISLTKTMFEVGESINLPLSDIEKTLNDGTAFASLCSDLQLKEQWQLRGSPSYVLNDGRQILYGNVGYRIIEANVTEILHNGEDQLSWC